MQEGAVLEMQGICKYFPGVRALQDVDFTLREGEIHALMGENGAGKSTLIKVLTGVYPKDGGEVHIKGVEGAVVIRSPQDAQNAGISTVYQEITLCPNLSVAENIFIGRTKGNLTNWRAMNKRTGEILGSLGIPAAPQQQLGTCSIAVQQMVAIARAVDMECKVLILDEPTSSLDEQEVQKLFGLMRDLRKKGVGIIFVTHFLEQVYEVCDRITVLRDGTLVGEYVIEDLPRVKLVSKMLGKELDDMEEIKDDTQVYKGEDEYVFEAEKLQSDAGIKPFDFHIKKGEVNGFTGLLGSGRSECVRAIFCADKVIGGVVKIVMNYFLVGNPDINIHGAPISTLCCYLVIAGLNLFFVWKYSPTKPKYFQLFFKPTVATVLMGGGAWAVYGFMSRALSGHSAYGANAIATLCGILAGVIVYAILVVALRILRAEDLKTVPHGAKLAKLLHLR